MRSALAITFLAAWLALPAAAVPSGASTPRSDLPGFELVAPDGGFSGRTLVAQDHRYFLFGAFERMTQDPHTTKNEVAEITAFFRRLSVDPPFADCAAETDKYLAWFAPERAKSQERKQMLEKWKDSPGLGESVRVRMHEALKIINGERPVSETNGHDFGD